MSKTGMCILSQSKGDNLHHVSYSFLLVAQMMANKSSMPGPQGAYTLLPVKHRVWSHVSYSRWREIFFLTYMHTVRERCISVLHCFLVGSLVLHLSEFFSSFFFSSEVFLEKNSLIVPILMGRGANDDDKQMSRILSQVKFYQ